MKLRKWQSECINLAIDKYSFGEKHFLALATPGAGKTFMASVLADRMIKRQLVDIVICFSPSSVVCQDFSQSLEEVIGERFDGLLGAKGRSLTYQSMQYLDSDFWMLFQHYRVFVIFDEIHHCAGSTSDNANVWGEQIIQNIQDKAKYTIALTGTPWRSDTAPIVLSQYASRTSGIKCDYAYGLSDAINDGVCRIPQIIAIDNDNISVIKQDKKKNFSCFNDLLSQSIFPYQEVIQNEDLLLHVLEQANDKLNEIRLINPSAGGLVVASSVEHVTQIANLLTEHFNETATIITYREDDPTRLIHQYRQSNCKWVVSVGMISEGTNIPRLQVTCHLTRIKTEMHFRQTLGRNLRITDATNQEAFLYMPAEPKLVTYARRIAQSIPAEANIVKFEKMNKSFVANMPPEKPVATAPDVNDPSNIQLSLISFEQEIPEPLGRENQTQKNALTDSYETMLNIFGRFRQETLELGLAPLK